MLKGFSIEESKSRFLPMLHTIDIDKILKEFSKRILVYVVLREYLQRLVSQDIRLERLYYTIQYVSSIVSYRKIKKMEWWRVTI